MRGVIFTTLIDMLETAHGLDVTNDILDACQFSHGGAYTSGGDYPDSDLDTLLVVIEEKAGIGREEALYEFGRYMFGSLQHKFKTLIEPFEHAKQLLLNVDSVIHYEVQKLYPQERLSVFEYEDNAPDSLTMIYQSNRRMCSLATGLIQGVSEHYNTQINIKHDYCMLKGFDTCRLELRFLDD